MDVQVLGPGCKNCEALEAATKQALDDLAIDQHITKITDYGEIASFGVMSTPALAIDGEVKVTGRVPSVDEIKSLLSS